MSRSKRGSDQVFARLQFKCPRGHLVGEAVFQHPKTHVLLNIGHGWIRVATADLDRTLRLSCGTCEDSGRALDLQASGRKVLEQLARIESDPRVGARDYLLGG